MALVLDTDDESEVNLQVRRESVYIQEDEDFREEGYEEKPHIHLYPRYYFDLENSGEIQSHVEGIIEELNKTNAEGINGMIELSKDFLIRLVRTIARRSDDIFEERNVEVDIEVNPS